MSGGEQIREGMQVFGSDDRPLGTVEGTEGDSIRVGGRQIPRDAIARVAQGRVYLRGSGAEFLSQGIGATRDQAAEGEIRVPVAEERLQVERREAELGEVQLRKTVEEEQQTVPVELQREEVHVERRDVGDRPAQGEDLFQEGTIRVPVRGEEAVVSKEAVVTGEVVVEKERTTEREEIRDTVRKERVEVDENYDRYRSGFQQHFDRRRQQYGTEWGARSWEDAEPNYQYGYSAGRDARYQGRRFEDVESDLQRDYQSRVGTGGQGGDSDRGLWERLREEIREGWDRARGA